VVIVPTPAEIDHASCDCSSVLEYVLCRIVSDWLPFLRNCRPGDCITAPLNLLIPRLEGHPESWHDDIAARTVRLLNARGWDASVNERGCASEIRIARPGGEIYEVREHG
jgi:hypothetical protein